MWLKSKHFFRLKITPASCSRLSACFTLKMCSSGVFENITISSIRTKAFYYFPAAIITWMAHWNVLRSFSILNGIRANRCKLRWNLKAAFYFPLSSVPSFRYQLLTLSVEKTVDSPKNSIHSSILGMRHQFRLLTSRKHLKPTKRRKLPFYYETNTIVTARLIVAF